MYENGYWLLLVRCTGISTLYAWYGRGTSTGTNMSTSTSTTTTTRTITWECTIHWIFRSVEPVTPPMLRSILCPSLPSNVLSLSGVIFYVLPLVHIPTYLVQLVHNHTYDSSLYKDFLQPHAFTSGFCSTRAFTVSSSKPFIIHFIGSFKHKNGTIILQVSISLIIALHHGNSIKILTPLLLFFILCITTTTTILIWTINNNVNRINQQQQQQQQQRR